MGSKQGKVSFFSRIPSPINVLVRAGKIGLLGIVVLACVFTANQFKLSRSFPIRTVRVYGVQHTDKQDVQEVLTPLVQQGFFSTNVDFIRERLLQLPWVSDLSVRRQWPDQVDITIVEKNVIARWNDNGLISAVGDVFTPREQTWPSHLPRLVGPVGEQMLVLGYFKDINRLLVPIHAKIAYLELTPFYTWKMTLDNGISMQVGHKDILTRLAHFVKVYDKIIGKHAIDVEYIDLRYPNGVAVRWKQQPDSS